MDVSSDSSLPKVGDTILILSLILNVNIGGGEGGVSIQLNLLKINPPQLKDKRISCFFKSIYLQIS